MQHHRQEHWEATLHVMHFLKANPRQRILLSVNCDLQLYAWCDSDWVDCSLTKKSLTGWFILLGNSPIS